jgi:MinD-like ATPase involved in chromosome partitioning or flagellar assembly
MVPSSVSEKEAGKIADRLAELFHLHVLTALPFNSDVLENLSKGVFVLERPRDPLTRRFTEIAMKMLEAIETGPSDEVSANQPKPQPVA